METKYIQNRDGLEEIRTPDLRRVKPPKNLFFDSGVNPSRFISLDRDVITTPTYTINYLDDYLKLRKQGITPKSQKWLQTAADILWEKTQGTASEEKLSEYREYVLNSYQSRDSHQKVLSFGAAFFKHLTQKTGDFRLNAFSAYFTLPKTRRSVKLMRAYPVTDEDVYSVLRGIETDGLSDSRRENFRALILFLAYTGQRPYTAAQITTSQVKEALSKKYPILEVHPEQDKIRLGHFVPLHPEIIQILSSMLEKGDYLDNKPIFRFEALQQWLYHNKIPLTHSEGYLQMKHLRKYFEQKSDELGFTDANKNFIMSHGTGSINWSNYKAFLPENVYKVYMRYWGDFALKWEGNN